MNDPLDLVRDLSPVADDDVDLLERGRRDLTNFIAWSQNGEGSAPATSSATVASVAADHVARGDDVGHGAVVAEHFQLLEPGTTWLKRPRWAGVAIALAAAIVVVVGGAVIADRNSGTVRTDPASSVEPANPVAGLDDAEPVSTTSVADPVSASGWSRVPNDETVFGGNGQQGMSSVTLGGPGFVAVGGDRTSTCEFSTAGWCRRFSDEGPHNAAVWTSVDGQTWARVLNEGTVFVEADIADVTAGGPGLVAVGGSTASDDESLQQSAVVWTSADGLNWARVAHDEAVFGEAEMRSVTVGGPGLVAVGMSVSTLGDGSPVAAVWTSVDGLTWSRVDHDEAVFGGPHSQLMLDVTTGGPGLVAVGYDGRGDWDNSEGQDAAVWTSTDGITWSRVAHDEDAFGGDNPAMLGVTAGGPGLVAVGYSFPHAAAAAVWTSVDGLTWSRVVHDDKRQMSGTMWNVTEGGPGLVAVGQAADGAAVWGSADGFTWSLIANDRTGYRMLAVTGEGPDLVAVGSEDVRGNGHAAVWNTFDR